MIDVGDGSYFDDDFLADTIVNKKVTVFITHHDWENAKGLGKMI